MFTTKTLIAGLVVVEVAGAIYTLNKMGLLDKAKAKAKAFKDDIVDSYEEGRNGTVRAEMVD